MFSWVSIAYSNLGNSSISVLAWEETLHRLFPQVLHTEKKTSRERKTTIAAVKETEKPQHCIVKRPKLSNGVSKETKAYPEFMFRHKFSLLVVGPTQCGKTFFFEKILSTDCILYESKKSRPIWWYYSQWQDRYKVMQSSIGKEWKIETDLFAQGRSQRKIFPKKEPNECSINL